MLAANLRKSPYIVESDEPFDSAPYDVAYIPNYEALNGRHLCVGEDVVSEIQVFGEENIVRILFEGEVEGSCSEYAADMPFSMLVVRIVRKVEAYL